MRVQTATECGVGRSAMVCFCVVLFVGMMMENGK